MKKLLVLYRGWGEHSKGSDCAGNILHFCHMLWCITLTHIHSFIVYSIFTLNPPFLPHVMVLSIIYFFCQGMKYSHFRQLNHSLWGLNPTFGQSTPKPFVGKIPMLAICSTPYIFILHFFASENSHPLVMPCPGFPLVAKNIAAAVRRWLHGPRALQVMATDRSVRLLFVVPWAFPGFATGI